MLLRLCTARLPRRHSRRNALAHARQLEDVKGRAPAELRPRVVAGNLRVPLQDLVRLRLAGRLAGQEAGAVARGRRAGRAGEVELRDEVADVGQGVADRGHFPAVSWRYT